MKNKKWNQRIIRKVQQWLEITSWGMTFIWFFKTDG